MKRKLSFLFLSALTIPFFMGSCSDDKEEQEVKPATDLVVDNNSVTLLQGDEITVSITSGNGDYYVKPFDENVATATIKCIYGVRETLTPADNSYEDCAPNSSLNLTDVGGNDKALLIGRSGDSYRVGYCKVYQARMWKRALDESEIKANMCKILNAEEHSDLMGYWVFSKGVGGTTVFENWGNGGSGLDAQVCLQNISENKPAWGADFLQLIMEIRAALNQLNVLIHTKTRNIII